MVLLEAIFQNLINRILEVQKSHKDSSDEKAMLSRNWEFIFSDFDGWLVLHCSKVKDLGGYWIYPMLHPLSNVGSLKEQLPSFSFITPSAAYSEIISGDKHWIESCWGNHDDFDNSEIPLFFHRHYYGYQRGKESYYEFNQLVTHLLDLHKSEKDNSYCRTDERGDEIEKIKIINNDEINLILIRRETLDKLLYLGKWVLIRYFVFSRFKTNDFSYVNCTQEESESKEYEATYQIRKCGEDFI